MTPHLRKVKVVNDTTLVELSEGSDFDHKPIYGVTVIKKIDNGFKSDNELNNFNGLFYTFNEAIEYVKTLEHTLVRGI
jgi:hypothetical protein